MTAAADAVTAASAEAAFSGDFLRNAKSRVSICVPDRAAVSALRAWIARTSPGSWLARRAAPGTHVLDQLVGLVRAGALGRHQVVQVEAQRANLAAQLRARGEARARRAWSASDRRWAAAKVRGARSCRRGCGARGCRARIGRACASARRNGRCAAQPGFRARAAQRTSFCACVQYFLLL